MIFHRRQGDSQRCCDALVRQTAGDERSDLPLTHRQSGERIGGRRQPGLHDRNDRFAAPSRPQDRHAESAAAQIEQRLPRQPASVLVGDLGGGGTKRLEVAAREPLLSVVSVRPRQ